jgi:hypothetical protein
MKEFCNGNLLDEREPLGTQLDERMMLKESIL